MAADDRTDESNFVELEDASLSYAFGEARPRGGMASFGQRPFSLGQHVEALNVLRPDDRADIEKLILSFEQLLPADVPGSFGTLTTSPYLSISEGQVETIDRSALDRWLGSQAFKNIEQAYEGNSRHEIKLSSSTVTLIDPSTASVTYTIVDKLPSGRTLTGTSAVIAVKQQGRWQIAVHCQHPV